jgi:outer membrane usher protein
VATHGLGLLGEAGISGSWGVFSQTFVAPNLVSQENQGVTRLQTSFRRDFPEQGYTLIAGDSVFRTGLLGRAAYFGGLQFGSNFGLAPYINRQPIPLIAGETSTPSTVQLYVNDVLRQTSNVPAGPFTLDNLPVLSGNGDVTVRVRDILGRETLITQPFLISAELLAPGLNDWSVEAGKLRKDLGTESWNYGEPFAAGMLRRGLSTTTTGEVRGELARGRRALGLAGVQAVGSDVLVRGGAMASNDENLGRGSRWLIGAERLGYTTTLGATLEGNSRNFRSLGEEDEAIPVRLQFAAQASWTTKWGRFGIAMALQRPHDEQTISTYSLNYSTNVRDNWQLSAFFTRAFGPSNAYTVGSMLVIPLGAHTNTATSLQVQKDRTEFYTSVTHTPESSTGWAWRAMAAHQGEARAEGGVNYLSPYGMFSAEASARRDQVDIRLGAVGAAIWTQGRAFAIPRFDNSAALVSVPGQEGVGVGIGAQAGQRTDAEGLVLVNRLSAYQKNPVRLDPNDLPLSAEIDSIEQDVVPPWRSVAKVDFAVRGGKAALLSIVLDDGEPAPAGATLLVDGDEREFLVARRGEAYVTGLKATNRLQMQWRQRRCTFDIALPAGGAEISRIGPVRCPGVAR